MKKILSFISVVIVSVLVFSSCAPAVVAVRPGPAVVVRPAAPSPRHVWVTGNYVWRNGRYVWTDGYWALPRGGGQWVDGHWKYRRGGYVWVPGHWR